MRDLIDLVKHLSGPELYKADELLWVDEQVAALREGRMEDVDRESITEVLLEMSKREQAKVKSRLIVLMMHILKSEHQPEKLNPSWVKTIREQRRKLLDTFEGTPTLRNYALTVMDQAYGAAVGDAALETNLPETALPETNPWTLDNLMTYKDPVLKVPVSSRKSK